MLQFNVEKIIIYKMGLAGPDFNILEASVLFKIRVHLGFKQENTFWSQTKVKITLILDSIIFLKKLLRNDILHF